MLVLSVVALMVGSVEGSTSTDWPASGAGAGLLSDPSGQS
jgi:hypothetical protein